MERTCQNLHNDAVGNNPCSCKKYNQFNRHISAVESKPWRQCIQNSRTFLLLTFENLCFYLHFFSMLNYQPNRTFHGHKNGTKKVWTRLCAPLYGNEYILVKHPFVHPWPITKRDIWEFKQCRPNLLSGLLFRWQHELYRQNIIGTVSDLYTRLESKEAGGECV